MVVFIIEGGYLIIKFFSEFRYYTKVKEIQIEHCETLESLLIKLCEKFGKLFELKLLEGSKLRDDIIILINGSPVPRDFDIETKLNETDTISILSVMAGG